MSEVVIVTCSQRKIMNNKECKKMVLEYTDKIPLEICVVVGQYIKKPKISAVIDLFQGSEECLDLNKRKLALNAFKILRKGRVPCWHSPNAPILSCHSITHCFSSKTSLIANRKKKSMQRHLCFYVFLFSSIVS